MSTDLGCLEVDQEVADIIRAVGEVFANLGASVASLQTPRILRALWNTQREHEREIKRERER